MLQVLEIVQRIIYYCFNRQLFAKVWTFGCNDEGSLGRTIEEEEESFLPGEVLIIFVIMKWAYCQIVKLR